MATATKHSHAHHHGAALAEAAQAELESRGEQWTQLRAAVFEILNGFEKPASAYDITEQLSAAQGRRIAANSVYRILDLFVGSNLAQRIESANAYIANPHPGCRHDCIFLVCDTCGQATHVDDDAVAAKVREAAEKVGFAPERPVIEVHGVCTDCAVKSTAS
ncbi:transcriptional repressor [Sphingomonas sp. CGMCC 1.13654]|uniref:Transcriptional repressor n=1 Tax=Sphingomonas chungangi TaxID=2683589 RepID=A0A838LCJ4_9SPHN|nr:Fur family transcriptional regulator [Sphingomonas chungangi]MBA2936592.1 transcriptional repressor [Sphingomonas chungangi]MVW55977.1 transcriptional repressor [Sphingomonas chungangi]